MSRVLEETTSEEIDREHIIRRIDDWVDRIEALYRQIGEWLPAGWSTERQGTVRMHEELMQKFGVSARELPVLQLAHDGMPSARIEPRGLWIIGANGRLDLFRGRHHYIIVDAAENFSLPDWQIAPLGDRRKSRKLDRETLISVL
jgi:hypothetical protein